MIRKLRFNQMKTLVPLFALLAVCALCSAVDFRVPDEKERMSAIGDVSSLPPSLQRAFDAKDFEPIDEPKPNDWLAAHPQNGQTFDDFARSRANKPDVTRKILYFLPLGAFSKDKSPPLEELKEYAAAVFQMEVKILPPLTRYSFTTRVNAQSRKPQILTRDVLDFFETKLPRDAFCLLGITMDDLYPAESWNFVFGQASLVDRVGIYSFARYDPVFFGQKRDADYSKLILKRSCKVLAHETGHMFGLRHCIYFNCAMNGSNHLGESDSRPMQFCPVCLRKLQHSTKVDVVKHYRDQQQFFAKVGFDEESAWLNRRIEKITK